MTTPQPLPEQPTWEAIGTILGRVAERIATVAYVIEELETSADSSDKDRLGRLARALNTVEAELEEARREAVRERREAAARIVCELAAVRSECQHIVDSQMLQIVQLQQELEQVKAERKERAIPFPVPAAAARIVEVTSQAPAPKPVERRAAEPVQFDAIDAALASSPPDASWSRLAV
jgi:hypothetical protein